MAVRERKNAKTITVRRAECVLKPRAATSSEVFAFWAVDSNTYTTFYTVAAGVYDASHNELRGLPITYTITDDTTGRTIATFAATSNANANCTVVVSLDSMQTVRTYTGRSVSPYPACALGAVSVPAADNASIHSSFAGSAQYKQSSSKPQAFS